jgi:hypothetical protein
MTSDYTVPGDIAQKEMAKMPTVILEILTTEFFSALGQVRELWGNSSSAPLFKAACLAVLSAR